MTFEEWEAEYLEKEQSVFCSFEEAMRTAWQAADRAARDECAKICDAYAKHNSMHRQHAEAAADCADEIRESIK